jgi:FlaA1/EpsC-like NDP-sugar epimerase
MGERSCWPSEHATSFQRLKNIRFRGVWLRRVRFGHMVADACLLALALVAATCLRYDFSYLPMASVRAHLLVGMGAGCLVALGAVQGLYTGRWLRASLEEAHAVAVAVWGATVGMIIIDWVLGQPVSAGTTVIAGSMALAGLAGLRVLRRLLARMPFPGEAAQSRVVVFGAGDAGKDVVGAMRRDPAHTYDPVALLDDDPAKSNLRLHGVAVKGTRMELERVAREADADTLLIAVPSADGALMRDLTKCGRAANLTVKVLPPVSEFFDLVPDVHHIRPVTVADLMGRREVEVDTDACAGYLAAARVLVTGAGGSIGSELCRQIRRLSPAALVMLDRDESALHSLQLSLDGRALLDERCLVVADIRDRARLERVFAEHRPEVVFHAAALKHLPLLEMHPEEALKTNVLGTSNVLSAAAASGVDRFVNISTDKAADPVCVLGYSKRIAERLTACYAARADLGSSRRFLSVRFGNVLGSRGSVLTAFRQQIAAGLPLTVTHPDVTRYFMTVEEAVRLVIQAGAVGSGGEVLVLDMGEPVRIADVAKQLIKESGLDLGIEYTGLRPGEKLHECLVGSGEVDLRPFHPQISHSLVPPLSLGTAASIFDLYEPDSVTDGLRQAACAPTCLAGQCEWTGPVSMDQEEIADAMLSGIGVSALRDSGPVGQGVCVVQERHAVDEELR